MKQSLLLLFGDEAMEPARWRLWQARLSPGSENNCGESFLLLNYAFLITSTAHTFFPPPAQWIQFLCLRPVHHRAALNWC